MSAFAEVDETIAQARAMLTLTRKVVPIADPETLRQLVETLLQYLEADIQEHEQQINRIRYRQMERPPLE